MLAATILFFGAAARCQSPSNPPAKYEADWASLKQHPVPEWYDDAKFGIFIHWGIYSVPAWAPVLHGNKMDLFDRSEFQKDPNSFFRNNPYAEWYRNTLSIKGSPTWKRHMEKYGANFDYYDFVPIFNREIEKWNPESWAELFKEAGAQYVVQVTKHHDGFTMWPSLVHNPHLPPDRRGTKRDTVGELAQAVRKQGLKMGLYYSGGLDWTFVPPPILSMQELIPHVPQSEEYARYADAQVRELIARYHPSILWDDISYPKRGDLVHIFTEYYNQVPEGVINDRFQVEQSDFTTPEYAQYSKIVEKKWETCRGLGFSFAYSQDEGPEQVLSSAELVRLLVDIVSKNGNLLLNIGPKADGTIPEIQVERLRALGRWLRINGEAIYGTHPWVRPNGRTQDGTEIRFTQKGDSVYAILMDKPKTREITVESLWPENGATLRVLGTDSDLPWSRDGKNIKVTLPEPLPGDYAYALKITPKAWQVVKE